MEDCSFANLFDKSQIFQESQAVILEQQSDESRQSQQDKIAA